MRNRKGAFSLAGALLLAITVTAGLDAAVQSRPQTQSPPSQALLDRLPADMREKAAALLRLTEEQQRRAAALSDEELRAEVAGRLGDRPEAAEFILDLLGREPSARVRRSIVYSMRRTHWRTRPEAQRMLERLAVSDPDAGVSLQALELLRTAKITELATMLEARIAAAKKAGDAAALKQLSAEQERWYALARGTMLPSFLRKVPEPFSLKAAAEPVRVVAFGDFGTGSDAQKQVAQVIAAEHRARPFDFGITLGDNFYPVGMMSPADPRWQTQWEALYGLLGIKFYATLGNHDWAHADSPAAELLYAARSETWRMPAPYYTFTAGPVQFFALDTVSVSDAQLAWLEEELARSSARWKVAYGHHHIYSATRGDNRELISRLLPVLAKGGVSAYVCGHDHNLQHVRPEQGVHFFIAGGGGAGTYETTTYERTIFKAEAHGFAVIDADSKRLRVRLIDKDGKQLHEYAIEGGAASSATSR